MAILHIIGSAVLSCIVLPLALSNRLGVKPQNMAVDTDSDMKSRNMTVDTDVDTSDAISSNPDRSFHVTNGVFQATFRLPKTPGSLPTMRIPGENRKEDGAGTERIADVQVSTGRWDFDEADIQGIWPGMKVVGVNSSAAIPAAMIEYTLQCSLDDVQCKPDAPQQFKVVIPTGEGSVGLWVKPGGLITAVEPDTDADKQGLKPGMSILTVREKPFEMTAFKQASEERKASADREARSLHLTVQSESPFASTYFCTGGACRSDYESLSVVGVRRDCREQCDEDLNCDGFTVGTHQHEIKELTDKNGPGYLCYLHDRRSWSKKASSRTMRAALKDLPVCYLKKKLT